VSADSLTRSRLLSFVPALKLPTKECVHNRRFSSCNAYMFFHKNSQIVLSSLL
jgi:hypothetical protein